jgi:phosphatidylserine/phosphatidylglycerophosphate/cardiolipin synthase-like enzyme
VDDEWFSIGSANLNRRGLATDTEMNVQAIAPEVARPFRVRLWAEHLGLSVEEVDAEDPISLVDDHWLQAASTMETCMRTSIVPPKSQAQRYSPGRNPGSRLLDVIQDISLER